MEPGKIKLSITLDPAVVQRLPKQNRSYAIESILKQHFQAEAKDQLYRIIKQQLLKDYDVKEYMKDVAVDVLTQERGY